MTLYISLRFEFKMAVAAIVAVIHDILVTVGIYSLAGFQVTPDTVVAVLTVLGYSLYDTVVVFDRIRENSKGLGASGRITYSDMVNLSMNQTLARSINTSLVAIIPVLSVLVVGSYFLGATSLQDFGLALVIGLTSGAYSSIFIASPLLALMKEREPRYITIRQRLETRGERGRCSPRPWPRPWPAPPVAPGVGGPRAGPASRTPGSSGPAPRPRPGGHRRVLGRTVAVRPNRWVPRPRAPQEGHGPRREEPGPPPAPPGRPGTARRPARARERGQGREGETALIDPAGAAPPRLRRPATARAGRPRRRFPQGRGVPVRTLRQVPCRDGAGHTSPC